MHLFVMLHYYRKRRKNTFFFICLSEFTSTRTYFSLLADDIGHESPEPARRDVNSAGRRQTSLLLLSSALMLLAAILSL